MKAGTWIRSIANVRSPNDRLLSECYVISLGLEGLGAIAERPVPLGTPVLVDIEFIAEDGQLVAERVPGSIIRSEPRRGSVMLNIRFSARLSAQTSPRLVAFIQRETREDFSITPGPRYREAGA